MPIVQMRKLRLREVKGPVQMSLFWHQVAVVHFFMDLVEKGQSHES